MKGKEYVGKTLKELNLTIEDFRAIADEHELSLCDCCGTIESTYDLIWVEYCSLLSKTVVNDLLRDGLIALCDICYEDKSKGKRRARRYDDGPMNVYLGILCKRGHDHNGTGKSLRYKSSKGCLACHVITKNKWLKRRNNGSNKSR